MGNKRYNVQPRQKDRANERSADLMCPTGNELDEDDDDDDTYIVFEETPIDEELKLNSSNIQFYSMNNVSVCYYKLFLLFENRNTC